MMLGPTRIAAFDNEPKDLEALVRGINGTGAACLGFIYTGDIEAMGVISCPYVRVIFFDLNMVDATTPFDFTQHYSNIGALLRRIKPKGPYILVLWTRYEDRVHELEAFLNERLTEVPKPFSVEALPKEKYIDESGLIAGIEPLVDAIKRTLLVYPALAALSDWEEKVYSATSETLSSVTMMARKSKSGEEQRRDIPRLLTAMAVASAGRPNVASNPLRAVSEALLPVLTDHVSSSSSDLANRKAWKDALEIGDGSINEEEAAQLNTAMHIAHDTGKLRGAERGAIVPLCTLLEDVSLEFKEIFGLDEGQAALRQFLCDDFAGSDAKWILMRAQAACDYAQRQPGPLPFYLGLEMSKRPLNLANAPAALWQSPGFLMEGEIRELRVNFRFHMSLAVRKVKGVEPIYRLREQLLGTLTHALHMYGSRPGVISLRSDDDEA